MKSTVGEGFTATKTVKRVVGRRWEGHDMEAWIASWDCHDRETLYSGADDGVLKRWDMRSPEGFIPHTVFLNSF